MYQYIIRQQGFKTVNYKLSQDNTPNFQVILMKSLVKFSQSLHFLLPSICTACFKLLEKRFVDNL